MKFKLLLLLCFPLLIWGQSSALYYPAHGGRTGDKLIHLVKAMWAAHQSGLPLYIVPFGFSEYLDYYYTERHYTQGIENQFKWKRTIKTGGAIKGSAKEDTWLTVGFFFKSRGWKHYEVGTWTDLMADQTFRKLLRERIRLVRPYTFEPPTDRGFTVALHVRRGGGRDAPLYSPQFYDFEPANIPSHQRQGICPKKGVAEEDFPHKFPPMQYYINALKTVSYQLENRPMYVYLYTDDPNPEALIEQIRVRCALPNVTFDCHQSASGPDTLILEDMIAMSRYDILIRGGSNYPQISHLIGKHKMVVYPLGHYWYGDYLIMDPIKIDLNWTNLSRDDRHYLFWRNFQLK